MARKLSAIDKEKLRILRNSEALASSAIMMHKRICATCHDSYNWPARACDDGWRLAKKVKRAENDLAVFMGTAVPDQIDGQLPLWNN